MDISSVRRLAENQVVFRKLNRKPQEQFNELNRLAAESGEQPHQLDGTAPLHFYCECSDENCRQRIVINLDDYEKYHERNDSFIVVPGHEVDDVEYVTKRTSAYFVVQKHDNPPQDVDTFNSTSLQND